MARCGFAVPLILMLGPLTFAEVPPSDPQAVAFASQAIAALTSGIAVNDVTLTGNATLVAGSDTETGTARHCSRRVAAKVASVSF
jgi:hypothetical protein